MQKYGVSNFLGEAKLKSIYPMVVPSDRDIPVLLDEEGEGKVRPLLFAGT